MSHIMRKCVLAICQQQRCDQPAQLRSLISTFVVHCLDSIIPLVSLSEISSLYLTSVAEQAGLSLTWLEILKTGFPVTWLICLKIVDHYCRSVFLNTVIP